MAPLERGRLDPLRVRFWYSDKARERLLGEAFIAGVKKHGDEGDFRALGQEPTFDCDVACMVGVKSRDLYRAHTRAGVQVVYLDKGYDRHSRSDDIRGWEYWRVAVNGHQPTSKFRPDYPGDRLAMMGWKFKPWRAKGQHIVLAGSSAKYHNFYDLKEPTGWSTKLIKELNNYTTRPIHYRPKPSWKDAVPIDNTTWSGREQGIMDALWNAHCLVTHGSNSCFEAMLEGIPSIILGEAVMKPISSTSLKEIESPRLARDSEREAVLRFLAYSQWTMGEMNDGLAWATIRKQFFE